MTLVAGADGCRSGWVVVLRQMASGGIEVRTVDRLSIALNWNDAPEVICVDVPIGLLDAAVTGGRDCDRAARVVLGEPRRRSVFSPPVRATLTASSFEEAVRMNRASSDYAIGISRQCFGILPKIREVDEFISSRLQNRVREVHPELSFYEMNDASPVIPSKKSERGIALRLSLLECWWRCELTAIVDAHRGAGVARDDVIDAMATCWTAERIVHGRALCLPEIPPCDSHGLRMEIVR